MQEDQAAEILKTIIYATVATTSTDSKPHNSPLRFVYDENVNIYWFSDKESQHSKNIRENNAAYIVIYDSTVPEGQGKGVYIEATVQELSDPAEISKACRIKMGAGNDSPDLFMGDAVRRVYKATPLKIWTNGVEVQDGVLIRDLRANLSLVKLKQSLSD